MEEECFDSNRLELPLLPIDNARARKDVHADSDIDVLSSGDESPEDVRTGDSEERGDFCKSKDDEQNQKEGVQKESPGKKLTKKQKKAAKKAGLKSKVADLVFKPEEKKIAIVSSYYQDNRKNGEAKTINQGSDDENDEGHVNDDGKDDTTSNQINVNEAPERVVYADNTVNYATNYERQIQTVGIKFKFLEKIKLKFELINYVTIRLHSIL